MIWQDFLSFPGEFDKYQKLLNMNKHCRSPLACCAFVYICALFLLTGCDASEVPNYTSPKEYDLNHPYTINMVTQLDEISGIVYYPKDTSVFAISDEGGWLYKVFLKTQTLQKWKFGKNSDFEDLQLIDSTFYIMASKGDITSIRFYSADSMKVEEFKFPEGKNEFEAIFYNKANGTLNMICKDCASDKKKSVGIWVFDYIQGSFQLSPDEIDVTPIAEKLGVEKVKFKPSAAAINPVTNELFIISAVNRTLIVVDTAGMANEVYTLNPSIFKQPEGLCFTPAGDLLISNESNMTGTGNILVFKRKKILNK